MGCLFTKCNKSDTLKEDEEDEAPKQYSWDKREQVDPKDFTIENLKGETVGRMPGTTKGQQFIIQNCEDTNIYLFDHIATITVDKCTNCRLFIGPIKTSIFVRNCEGCKMMLACQQFRSRDCKKMDLLLCCVSQPIIESSTGMNFGCYQYNYPELEEQFQQAGLSVYNNNWSNIHDFSPVPGENNFKLLPQDLNIEDFIPLPTGEPLSSVHVNLSIDGSVVPNTLGKRRKPSDDSCLVMFFYDGGSHGRAKDFIKEMKTHHSSCAMVQSKEISMQPNDTQRIFGTDSYASAATLGPVIGMEYNGQDSCKHCQDTLVAITQGTTGLVFVSPNPESAAQQIDSFYNYADMQMNA